jgi:hypothetical protein
VGQRIEQLNCYDLAGSTCTLSVNMSNSLLTTVTWTASYATSANTWSAKTTISTGTFTVTSSLANYTTQIVVPAAATTGIEILFTVGAQTSGTWVIGNAQFEPSTTVATSFDYRPYGTELALCQRYYRQYLQGIGKWTTTTNCSLYASYPVPMRATPTAGTPSGNIEEIGLANRAVSAIASVGGNEYGTVLGITTAVSTIGAIGGSASTILPLSAEL